MTQDSGPNSPSCVTYFQRLRFPQSRDALSNRIQEGNLLLKSVVPKTHPNQVIQTLEKKKPFDSRIVSDVETGRQRRGSLFPRINSFFQFLRGSEPEIERYVNELDEASFSTRTSLFPKANAGCSV